jgi:hypothetical protein
MDEFTKMPQIPSQWNHSSNLDTYNRCKCECINVYSQQLFWRTTSHRLVLELSKVNKSGTYVVMEATWASWPQESFTTSYKLGSINLIEQLPIWSHPRAIGKILWHNETLYSQGYMFCVTLAPKLGRSSLVGLNWNELTNNLAMDACLRHPPW